MSRIPKSLVVFLLCVIASGGQSSQGNHGSSGGSGVKPVFGSYTFNTNGTTVNAVNNATGTTDYTGSDLAVVFNQVTTALATVGGHLFFKNGVYPINSMTLESATGCSNFIASGNALAYALAFPSNTFSASVQWLLEGEADSIWQGEAGSTSINTSGVIFNVTSTAVSSVAAGSVLAGIWQRPTASGCTLVSTLISNDAFFKNLTIRFPTNQRGNEIGIAAWFLADVQYENVLADFNLAYNSIATGSAPVVGSYNSIGLTSTVSSSGNWQDFRNTYAVGWNIAYDFQSEHVSGTQITAIYNNIAAEFGRSGTAVFHPSKITLFVDQENLHGILLGNQMLAGSRLDIDALDIELGVGNWYARTIPNMVESNVGNTSGIITYEAVTQGTGIVVETPPSIVFSSGGQNFQAFEGTSNPNIALVNNVVSVTSDTFTRANNIGFGAGFNGLGVAWLQTSAGGSQNFQIASNSAQVNSTSSQQAWSAYIYQNYANSAQFSQAKVGTINANATSVLGVTTNTSTVGTIETFYVYWGAGAAAGGTFLDRVTAGSFVTLTSQTSAIGAATGDVLELRSIPSGACVVLFAYRNGVLDTNLPTNPYTDCTTPLSGGAPGLFMQQSTAGAVSATNFRGGSLPTIHGNDAESQVPQIVSTLSTLSNCSVNSVSPAACGSAASGAVVVPTTVTTYTVNTTRVTAHSRIFLTPMSFAGDLPSAPTCVTPAVTAAASISAISTGVSFTMALPNTTGQSCWQYFVVD